MSDLEVVRVSTRVPVSAGEAFEIFTSEIDLWWKRGPAYRVETAGKAATMRFEPRVGGRLLCVYDSDEEDAFELGRIRVWDPPGRLVFGLGGRDFDPGQFAEVEITFESDGDGTRVVVEHSGFEALGPDHPVRHGLDPDAFRGMMGLWWADLLVALQRVSKERASG